jgi:ABC-2 type transport system ATP-binding protein
MIQAAPRETTEATGDRSVISVRNLRKTYGQFEAVKGIDFDIKRGEIFGLIGPDGAGKTSTFHILGGVMEPTAGDISVLGKPPREARLKIGYLTQQFSLNLDLSINENIAYTAGIREVPRDVYYERRDKYLRLMGLYGFGSRLAGQLSGGMKQKLALCCSLIFIPEVLLLDEPTTGVDPVSRREFWDVLAAVASEGVTIVVATPYLDEAERCHRVALMYGGEIHQLGPPAQLIHNLGLHRLEVRSDKLEQLEEALRETKSNTNQLADIQEFGDRLDVLVENVQSGEAAVRSEADKLQIANLKVEKLEPTLENVFVASLRRDAGEVSDFQPFSFKKSTDVKSEHEIAIGADKISIFFGDFQAVKSVSLKVEYGKIYGLLGANGAGKTTTIKMLCGLLTPSSGEMILAGQKSNLRSSALRQRIGYMSQKFTLYDDLTCQENLEFYCGVYEVPRSVRKERIEWALRSCGLLGQEKLMTGRLPGGWKQRLSFGASVMHQPEILFLDEPTSGVDPLARRQLWQMIRDFADHGTAILVTTHFLEEAEHCQELGFMVAGEVVARGTPSEIKAGQPGQLIEIVTDQTQLSSNVLKQVLDSWRVSIFADRLHVVLDNPEREFPEIMQALQKAGVNILGQRSIGFSLEDAFIGIVQRAGVKNE